jgi:hypothetical protein
MMSVLYGEKRFISDQGTLKVEFDICTPGGNEWRKSDGYVPILGRDRVNVRLDFDGAAGHYALLAQDGYVHAVQNGTPLFLNTDEDDGFLLYTAAFPIIQAAIERHAAENAVPRDLVAIITQGAGIPLKVAA